ncbi:hypothetical protein OSTOST_06354, partial [Ostertagia ostertagi]
MAIPEFQYGQNPRYFEEYLDELREFLQFSPSIREEGNHIMEIKKMERGSTVCIHTRRTDFVALNIATDVNQTMEAADQIAGDYKTFRFMIFGDDKVFMQDLAKIMLENGKWEKGGGSISNASEGVELYLSSQVCRAFLLTAVTSTFGWWLAFFALDQSAVFYVTDNRTQNGKEPSRELFL